MQKKEIFQVIIFFSQFNWELDIGQNCIFRIFLIQCLSKIIDRQHEDQRSKVLRITEINTGLYSVCAKSLQSCLTLYDTVDYSPPGFSVHGILQRGVLECIAMPTFRRASQHRIQPDSLMICAWQAGFLPLVPPGKPQNDYIYSK